MFEHRVPRMLAADFASRGSIDLHIKDLVGFLNLKAFLNPTTHGLILHVFNGVLGFW